MARGSRDVANFIFIDDKYGKEDRKIKLFSGMPGIDLELDEFMTSSDRGRNRSELEERYEDDVELDCIMRYLEARRERKERVKRKKRCYERTLAKNISERKRPTEVKK